MVLFFIKHRTGKTITEFIGHRYETLNIQLWDSSEQIEGIKLPPMGKVRTGLPKDLREKILFGIEPKTTRLELPVIQ